MKKLLKAYGMQTNEQYYHMVHESLIVGQIAQARMQFNKLPHENKKEFINSIEHNPEDKKFFFDML